LAGSEQKSNLVIENLTFNFYNFKKYLKFFDSYK